MKKETRRSFIKKSAISAAGMTLAGNSLSAAGYRRIMGASDRINVAVIGNYRRANAMRQSFADLKDKLNILYVCDVVKERRDTYAESLKEAVGYVPDAVNDYREILADPKVDAIFLFTPDHWHAPGTWMALEAGKHVYVEKPLTHNPREGELLLQYHKKYNKIVQMGSQQRSQFTAQKIISEIHDGLIGDIYSVMAYYINNRGSIGNGKVVPVPDGFDWDLFQGPAPREAYKDIYFDYYWHWFWTWGTGETGNNAAHEFDVARWVLKVAHPQRVEVNAGKFYYVDDDWTMYDTMEATFVYPGGVTIKWDGRSRTGYSAYGSGRGNIVYGSKGTVAIGRNGYTVYDLKGDLIREEEEATRSQTTSVGGEGGITTNHVNNFLEAIKGTAKSNSVLSEAVKSNLMCHTANIAYKTGQPLISDPITGHILDKKIMKEHWAREYEPGWGPRGEE